MRVSAQVDCILENKLFARVVEIKCPQVYYHPQPDNASHRTRKSFFHLWVWNIRQSDMDPLSPSLPICTLPMYMVIYLRNLFIHHGAIVCKISNNILTDHENKNSEKIFSFVGCKSSIDIEVETNILLRTHFRLVNVLALKFLIFLWKVRNETSKFKLHRAQSTSLVLKKKRT